MISRFTFLTLLALAASSCAQAAAPKAEKADAAPIETDFIKETGFTYGPWHSSVLGGGGYIQNVVPAPTNPQRFYAYVDVGGLYRSDDGGRKWRMLHGHLPAGLQSTEVRGLIVDPRDDKKIIVATGSQWAGKSGVWVSDDAGETFQKKLDAQYYGNGGSRSAGFVLTRAPSNPNLILTGSVTDGVFKSLDNGQTWKPSGGAELYPSDLDIDRTNPQQVWMCAVKDNVKSVAFKSGFYRSSDGGANWEKLADDAPTEIIQDPKDAKLLYGIFQNARIKRSSDGGANWEDLSEGLNLEPLKEGKGKPSISWSGYRSLEAGPDFILTGTTSDTQLFKLQSGATKWQKVERNAPEVGDWFHKGSWYFGGAMGSITIDPNDANHWFITDFFAIYQTHDAGKNWRLTIDGIEVTVSHALLQDPSDPAVVHLGQADVGPATSLDGGKRLHQNRVPDDPGSPSGGKNMKCIDLCPKLPNRLYGVGDNSYYNGWVANQIYVSIDRGATWLRSPMAGLPDMKSRACTTITADLSDPYTVYVTIAGKVSGGGGVYKSTDGGALWTPLNDGLPDKYLFPYSIWAHGRQLAIDGDGAMLAMSQQNNHVFRFDPKTGKWADTSLRGKGKMWSVVADRLKPGRFFVGIRSDGLYRTDDAGLTWKKVYDKSVSFVATDAAKAGRVAGGTLDGVVLSEDGGDTWKMLDKALPYRFDNIPAFAGERLLVGSAGSGVFWMALSPAGEKEVSAKPVKIAAVPPATTTPPQLVNASFEDKDATIPGWKLEVTAGKATMERTNNGRSGGAALTLKTEGVAKGRVYQDIAPTSRLWTLDASIYAKGDLKNCALQVQYLDAAGAVISADNFPKANPSRKWWESFGGAIGVPADAKTCRIAVNFEGDGEAILDKFEIGAPKPLFLQ